MSNSELAAPELGAVEIEGVTRGSFILRSALAAGAVYGTSMVSPFVRHALAQEGDVEIVNFALTLEFLEADFYRQAKKLGGLGSEAKELADEFGGHEQEHVEALSATVEQLGGKAVKEPKFRFGVKDEKSFLKLAMTLEDTGVSAYNGAAPAIASEEVLGAAGTIVQIEARHAAAIRLLREQDPAPDAFDKSLTMDQVLKAVKPFVRA